MTLDKRLRNLEDKRAGRYIAVVQGEEIPDTVTASLPGGRDRQEMAPDGPRLGQIIHLVYEDLT